MYVQNHLKPMLGWTSKHTNIPLAKLISHKKCQLLWLGVWWCCLVHIRTLHFPHCNKYSMFLKGSRSCEIY